MSQKPGHQREREVRHSVVASRFKAGSFGQCRITGQPPPDAAYPGGCTAATDFLKSPAPLPAHLPLAGVAFIAGTAAF